MSGFFITLEGVEGAGKTTQAALLAAALRHFGTVYSSREPGGEPVAEAIRKLLLQTETPVANTAELLLFLAARAQLTERILRPKLAAGQILICDRYSDSTVAYQGYARGADVQQVESLCRIATGDLEPDLTLLLDLDPALGIARQQDHNRMEREDPEFHQRVRAGFLQLAARNPRRIVTLDAAGSQADLHIKIVAVVSERLT